MHVHCKFSLTHIRWGLSQCLDCNCMLSLSLSLPPYLFFSLSPSLSLSLPPSLSLPLSLPSPVMWSTRSIDLFLCSTTSTRQEPMVCTSLWMKRSEVKHVLNLVKLGWEIFSYPFSSPSSPLCFLPSSFRFNPCSSLSFLYSTLPPPSLFLFFHPSLLPL